MKSGAVGFYRYLPISRRDRIWGLYVTTVGEARIAPHTLYPPGGHPKGFAFDWQHGRALDCFGLLYISSGRGKFESKPNISVSLEAGHAFLLFPGVWHRYTPDPETGWHEHWIGFDGETARNWRRHRFISPHNPVLKVGAEDTVLAAFSQVMQATRANHPALQQVLAGAAASLVGLFYSAQQGQPVTETQTPNAIALAIARIQNEYALPLDMDRLAQELGVSYSWFRSRFAAHTGLSPHQYLLEFRLAHARSLLAETNLSVKQIALETGFEDEHYFSRLFRHKLSLTPSQWRSRNRHAISTA
jgi:AraC-like DNA-binding protein